jgi:hypothetical protein
MLVQGSRKLVIVAGALLALAAVVTALLISDQSDAAPEGSPAETFSVLKPVTPERMDAVPTQAKAALTMAASAPLPGNEGVEEVEEIGLAKLPSGGVIAVAAVGDSICAARNSDSSCLGAREVKAQGSFGARPQGCEYWVFGVVPDRVASIAVDTGSDGSTDLTLPVASNVYEGTVPAALTSATGLDENGNAVYKTDWPLDYYKSTNPACS